MRSICFGYGTIKIADAHAYAGKISVCVEPLIETLKASGFVANIEKVGYELQRGGNEMLRVERAACEKGFSCILE